MVANRWVHVEWTMPDATFKASFYMIREKESLNVALGALIQHMKSFFDHLAEKPAHMLNSGSNKNNRLQASQLTGTERTLPDQPQRGSRIKEGCQQCEMRFAQE